MQPTTSTPAPAATPAVPAPQPAAPTANITRTDGVVGGGGGSTPVAGGTQSGTLQPSGGAPAVAPAAPTGGLLGGGMMFIVFIPIAVLMIISMMNGRKDTKKRAELMASLQRNDKVETIGGMIGTIAEISDTEVILKTDEITNTRITLKRTAISAVLNRSSKPGAIKASA